jgi:thiamine kinase-like enzyme
MNASFQNERLEYLMRRIPLLKNASGISPLVGGLTNFNYRVDSGNKSYVLRLTGSHSELLGINRANEAHNTMVAWKAGVGAPVISSLPEENLLLIGWLNGRTLHASDLQNEAGLIPRVAGAIRRLHGASGFRGIFHFPTVRAGYIRTVRERGYFEPAGYAELEMRILAIEKRLAQYPEALVPCNNDLLAENFIDDGSGIRIIDYEYAGQNEASFELGNLAGESGLTEQQLALLCDAYWAKTLPAKLARARAWSIVARFGWVLWASIQEAVSPIAFDFRAWGIKKWASVSAEIQGDPYEEIIHHLKRPES